MNFGFVPSFLVYKNLAIVKAMNNEIHMRVTMSEFPDELLLKILSFLSSKDVVATSAMSKRSGSSIESLPLKLNQYFLSVLINPL
ncbi:hypothetical protein HID58_069858, partial [Brassica napus]